jgi:hypothetical protein
MTLDTAEPLGSIRKMKNRILILDLDGVLITTPIWKSDEIHIDGYSQFNSSCIDNLNELLSIEKFEIWLSSSRRTTKSIEEFNEIFKNRGIKRSIKGFLPIYEECKTRKDEIEKFIQEKQLSKYLIIDDDKSLNGILPEIKKQLIITNLMIGFNSDKLKEAKKVLNEISQQIKVRTDSQDRSSIGWENLLKLIDECESNDSIEFNPGHKLLPEEWKGIRSLPKDISKLKFIKHLMLYGSNLQRLPQEIGQLSSLEKFTPYTSYGLRWFPYEIIECKKLKESTVSTRALFGNRKNKKPFPILDSNPVKYHGGNKCSICKQNETQSIFEQYWISTHIGTDLLPLLAIVCSEECFSKIVNRHKDKFEELHKGGVLKRLRN